MKPDAIKCGLASAITFAILWIVCSIIVWLLPSQMMAMSGHMVHANFDHVGWNLSFSGVLLGLIAWSFLAGISGWLIAIIYNLLPH